MLTADACSFPYSDFSANIKTVINLQESGEHASCGPGLEASGFSYNPQDFMDKDSKLFTINLASLNS